MLFFCPHSSSNGDIRSWDLRKTQAVSSFQTMNALYMCEAHPSAPLMAWYVLQQLSSNCVTVSCYRL